MSPRAEAMSITLTHDFEGLRCDVVRSDPPTAVRRIDTVIGYMSSYTTTVAFTVHLINEVSDEQWIEEWSDLARLDGASRRVVMNDMAEVVEALRSVGYDIDISDLEDET